jgi:hypothetical protein
MRIRTLNTDGSRRDAEVEVPIRNAEGELYTDPPVVIRIRLLPKSRVRELQRECTKNEVNKRTRGTQRVVDWDEVAERALAEAIQSWSGVLSDDGDPVTVGEVAVRELPPHVKAQLGETLGTTEAADETAGSFRESPDLVRVVG